jgi:transcription antitermination factor NusG
VNATLVDNRTETALSRPGNDSADTPATSRMPCGRNQGWAVGYRVFLPMFATLVRDPVLHTRTRLALRPLFPRYVFVWLTGPWVPIRYAPGVSDLLMTDGKPAYAPEASVEALEATQASRRTISPPGPAWRPGDPCETVLGGNQRVGGVVISVRRRKAVVAAVMLGALREITVPVESLRPRGE